METYDDIAIHDKGLRRSWGSGSALGEHAHSLEWKRHFLLFGRERESCWECIYSEVRKAAVRAIDE